MIDPITYLAQVSWETVAKDIVKLTDLTYRVTVKPENINQTGAGQLAVGFYFTDNTGDTYLITAINVGGISSQIEVTDSFKCYRTPASDRTAIICKSVGDGKAPFLSPSMLDRLDRSARDKIRSFELDILWKGKTDLVQVLSGLTPTWSVNLGIHATITLSGNTTITLSNLVAGMSGNLTIINPTAIYTLTFAGYTNEISPAIWKADNQPIVSGLTLKDVFSWYYDGSLLLWNGTNGYKP